MALSKKSKQQLNAVKDYITAHNIIKIHTRGVLDRIIEKIKFPYTQSWKKCSDLRCCFKNQQYDPIRKELVRSKFLTETYDGYRYQYTVNR